MTDHANGEPLPNIDKSDWMKGQMVVALRTVEKMFPGAAITVIVSEPGTAKLAEAQYNHVTTADAPDLVAVLRQHLAEIE